MNNSIKIDVHENLPEIFLKMTPKNRNLAIKLGSIALIELQHEYIKNDKNDYQDIIEKKYKKKLEEYEEQYRYQLEEKDSAIDKLKKVYQQANDQLSEQREIFDSKFHEIEKLNKENMEVNSHFLKQRISELETQKKEEQQNYIKMLEHEKQNKGPVISLLEKQIQEEKNEKNDLKNIVNELLRTTNANSSNKGKIGENHIKDLININFPNYMMEDVSKEGHQGDYHLYFDTNTKIIIEVKNYDSEKIRNSQIDKLRKDIDYCDKNNIKICGAVMISINTDIVGKECFDYEEYRGKPIIFISKLNSDQHKHILVTAIKWVKMYIEFSNNYKNDKDKKIYLVNYFCQQIKKINEIISNIDDEKNLIDDIFKSIQRQQVKYTRIHKINIDNLNQLLLDINDKISNSSYMLDDKLDYLLNINDPKDISHNCLEKIKTDIFTLQSKYIDLEKKYNNEDSSIKFECNDSEKYKSPFQDNSEKKNIRENVLNSWLEEFDWLEYNDLHSYFKCNHCDTKFESNNAKKSVFNNHQKSKKHIQNSCVLEIT
tara:strand:- start:2911 stop:4536 length:1626 start_codon:yes stop_codon:yes gene_type:complete